MREFLLNAFGASWIQWVSILATVAFLRLIARQKSLGWPVGLVACAGLGYVYHESRLYADMTLQAVFAVQLLYGWWLWARGRGAEGRELAVTSLTARGWLWLGLAWAPCTYLWGALLHHFTDAALPWLDAGLAVASLLTQHLQARKVRENWLLWIVINLAYIGVFIARDLLPLLVLQVLLIGLAVQGWREWTDSGPREVPKA